jgi:hypothetical protein
MTAFSALSNTKTSFNTLRLAERMPLFLAAERRAVLTTPGWSAKWEVGLVSAQSPVSPGLPVPSVLILIALSTSKLCHKFRNSRTNPRHRMQILKAHY